jgi:flagellar hook-basal body complex protein FliE
MQITPELLNSSLQQASKVLGPEGSYEKSSSSLPFASSLQQAMITLQQTEQDSAAKVKGLLSGDGTDIHTALIATQKASLAFDLALAVRNKALGAYQQIMSMQF